MKRNVLTVVAVTLAALSCGPAAGEYDNNDLELVTAYTAKELCSCLFVQEQTEEYCRAWTQASPAIARPRIDFAQKRVTTSALILWGASARFVDGQIGCQLEQ